MKKYLTLYSLIAFFFYVFCFPAEANDIFLSLPVSRIHTTFSMPGLSSPLNVVRIPRVRNRNKKSSSWDFVDTVFLFCLLVYIGIFIHGFLKDKSSESRKKNKKTISLFQFSHFPPRLLTEVYWNFKNEGILSYEEFIETVRAYNAKRGVEWQPNRFILKSGQVTIRYSYREDGTSRKKDFCFFSDDMNFTSAELLYKIDRELTEFMNGKRYSYLNHLELVSENDLNNPLYRLRLAKNQTMD